MESVAFPLEAIHSAKLVLTDALIAESLAVRKEQGFDETEFDEIEDDTETENEEADAASGDHEEKA